MRKLISAEVCERHKVIPVSRSGNSIIVAMADPSNLHAIDDIKFPNGLCFSPDERRLYIVETGLQFDTDPLQHVRVFDVAEDGSLSGGSVLFKIAPGNADGIRCDEHGNVWSSAGDGVHCIDPGGELVGKILVPATVANLTFGGRNNSRLFLCASQALYAIYVNVRGAPLL